MPVKDLFRPSYRAVIGVLKFVTRVFFKTLSALLGRKQFLSLVHFIGSEVDTTIEVEGIKFEAGHYIPYFRAVTLMTKEPDTIAWIDDFMEEEEVLYDVGANIGIYSLYAATRKNATVLAFEPQATTYSVLNENIYLNGLADKIKALNIAMYNRTILSNLNVSEVRPGKAGNSFEVITVDSIGEPVFLQGMIGMRLDDFVESYDAPFPNHVKIDVDANEPEIVEGMDRILSDPRLKSIAVELYMDCAEPMDKIAGFGFEMLKGDRYVNHAMLALRPLRPRINFFFVRR